MVAYPYAGGQVCENIGLGRTWSLVRFNCCDWFGTCGATV